MYIASLLSFFKIKFSVRLPITPCLLLLVGTAMQLQAQDLSKAVVKHTYYSDKGILTQITFDTVLVHGILDAEDLKQYHLLLDLIPKSFEKSQMKDTSLTIWKDLSKPKLEGGNYGQTYVYNKDGYLTKYCYTGCVLCASAPYCLQLNYDPNNRLSSLKRGPLPDNTSGDVLELKLFYNARGDISEVFIMNNGRFKECLQVQY